MAVRVSDGLREALEGLDQAIDLLDARVTALMEDAPSGEHPAKAIVVERLDQMIGRIELALASKL